MCDITGDKLSVSPWHSGQARYDVQNTVWTLDWLCKRGESSGPIFLPGTFKHPPCEPTGKRSQENIRPAHSSDLSGLTNPARQHRGPRQIKLEVYVRRKRVSKTQKLQLELETFLTNSLPVSLPVLYIGTSHSNNHTMAQPTNPATATAPVLLDLTIDNITPNTVRINSQSADARLTYLMARLVSHLHDFARETRLSTEEWMAAIGFLIGCGQISNDVRNVSYSPFIYWGVCVCLGLRRRAGWLVCDKQGV